MFFTMFCYFLNVKKIKIFNVQVEMLLYFM
jgi:hypothetical protein